MDILLACLATLPSTRLLFISRPCANIAASIPSVVIRHIDKAENAPDIDRFVKSRLNESEKLFRSSEHVTLPNRI